MFERENMSGSNYNDRFRSPKMVLRVEKKLFVIEQPISHAPPANSKYLCSGMRVYFKKAATPQVMAIQGGRIQKANKKSLNAKGKGKGKGKDKSYIPKLKPLNLLLKSTRHRMTLATTTLKALRLDRGEEYVSQEFKDYLKAYGILRQLTPPYTRQLSGVSKRRNRTLLDMVRSMMNLTTLSLSFWDYALAF
nr:retrotransposon protein, putative, Ty1-copia subclass [Tanacetum cinerariifolium]